MGQEVRASGSLVWERNGLLHLGLSCTRHLDLGVDSTRRTLTLVAAVGLTRWWSGQLDLDLDFGEGSHGTLTLAVAGP